MKKTKLTLGLMVCLLFSGVASADIFYGETVINDQWRRSEWMGCYYTAYEPWIWSIRYEDWLWVDPVDQTRVYSDREGCFFQEFGYDLPYVLTEDDEVMVYNPQSPSISPDTIYPSDGEQAFSFANMPSGATIDLFETYYNYDTFYSTGYCPQFLGHEWINAQNDYIWGESNIFGDYFKVKAEMNDGYGDLDVVWAIKMLSEITEQPQDQSVWNIDDDNMVSFVCRYKNVAIEGAGFASGQVYWERKVKGSSDDTAEHLYTSVIGQREILGSWEEAVINLFSENCRNYEYRCAIKNYAGAIYSRWASVSN